MINYNTIYIIFRRAYHEDDLDYGTFKPLYISLDLEKAVNVFNNIASNIYKDKDAYAIKESVLSSIEYYRKNWVYEYKFDSFELDKLCTFSKNI